MKNNISGNDEFVEIEIEYRYDILILLRRGTSQLLYLQAFFSTVKVRIEKHLKSFSGIQYLLSMN